MFDYYDNPSIELFSIFSKKPNCINDNFWELDLSKYKLYKVVLKPGDCLFIPPWWYHAVKGIDLSYSVSMFYERTDFNYLKMGNLKIRQLVQNLNSVEIIILYVVICNIILYVI
jgi:ribosomal protein L16 Arg81 hydroxylase